MTNTAEKVETLSQSFRESRAIVEKYIRDGIINDFGFYQVDSNNYIFKESLLNALQIRMPVFRPKLPPESSAPVRRSVFHKYPTQNDKRNATQITTKSDEAKNLNTKRPRRRSPTGVTEILKLHQ